MKDIVTLDHISLISYFNDKDDKNKSLYDKLMVLNNKIRILERNSKIRRIFNV